MIISYKKFSCENAYAKYLDTLIQINVNLTLIKRSLFFNIYYKQNN